MTVNLPYDNDNPSKDLIQNIDLGFEDKFVNTSHSFFNNEIEGSNEVISDSNNAVDYQNQSVKLKRPSSQLANKYDTLSK